MMKLLRFTFKCFFIHFLVVLLVDGQNPFITPFVMQSAFGQEAEGNPVGELLGLYTSLAANSGNGNPQQFAEVLSSETGEALMNQGQAFIADPANRAALNSEEGRALARLHSRFVRLRNIKLRMDNCFTGEYAEFNSAEFHGELPSRVFAAAYRAPDTELPCDPGFMSETSLDNLFGGVAEVVNGSVNHERVETLNSMQQDLQMKNLENATRSLVNLKHTYPDSRTNGEGDTLSDSELADIVATICTKRGEVNQYGPGNPDLYRGPSQEMCTAEQRERLMAVAAQKRGEISAEAPRYTYESAANLIYESFEGRNEEVVGEDGETRTMQTLGLNDRIREDENFELDSSRGIRSYIDWESEKNQTAASNYINGYGQIVQNHPGMLLLTDTLTEEIGGRMDQESRTLGIFGQDGFDYSNDGTARFKTHNVNGLNGERGANKVRSAVEESVELILSQAQEVHDLETNRASMMESYHPDAWGSSWRYYNPADIVDDRSTDLKRLIDQNPSSVGQLLMDNPAYAEEACRLMRESAQDTDSRNNRRKWMLRAGLALGAVALGGVGLMLLGGVAIAAGAGATAVGLAGTGGLLAAGGSATVGLTATALTALTVPGFVFGAIEGTDALIRANNASEERRQLMESYMAGGGDAQTVGEIFAAAEEAEQAAWEAGVAIGFTLVDGAAMIHIARTIGGARGLLYLRRSSQMFEAIQGSRRLKEILRAVKGAMGADEVGSVILQMTKLDNGSSFMRQIENLSDADALDLFMRAKRICDTSC